jgi:hypothetical protein
MQRLKGVAVLGFILAAAGCATHQFAPPDRTWTARNGQLAFHSKKRTVIGEVLVRFSSRGDFELTLSKGPGLILFVMRTDSGFARVEGPLAGVPWSGPLAESPGRALPWLKLRDEILRVPQQKTVHVNEGSESVVLRF